MILVFIAVKVDEKLPYLLDELTHACVKEFFYSFFSLPQFRLFTQLAKKNFWCLVCCWRSAHRIASLESTNWGWNQYHIRQESDLHRLSPVLALVEVTTKCCCMVGSTRLRTLWRLEWMEEWVSMSFLPQRNGKCHSADKYYFHLNKCLRHFHYKAN